MGGGCKLRGSRIEGGEVASPAGCDNRRVGVAIASSARAWTRGDPATSISHRIARRCRGTVPLRSPAETRCHASERTGSRIRTGIASLSSARRAKRIVQARRASAHGAPGRSRRAASSPRCSTRTRSIKTVLARQQPPQIIALSESVGSSDALLRAPSSASACPKLLTRNADLQSLARHRAPFASKRPASASRRASPCFLAAWRPSALCRTVTHVRSRQCARAQASVISVLPEIRTLARPCRNSRSDPSAISKRPSSRAHPPLCARLFNASLTSGHIQGRARLARPTLTPPRTWPQSHQLLRERVCETPRTATRGPASANARKVNSGRSAPGARSAFAKRRRSRRRRTLRHHGRRDAVPRGSRRAVSSKSSAISPTTDT